MRKRDVKRAAGSLVLVLALCLWGEAPARADKLGVAWKLPAAGVWPPAVLADRVVFKSGDTLTARRLDTGKKIWSADFAGLRYGTGVLAAGTRYIYVLAAKQLLVIDPGTGKKVRARAVAGPISVSHAAGSVYVTGVKGVSRFDEEAVKRLGRARRYTGELRGARKGHVVLHVPRGGGIKKGPERLEVVNLKSGRRTYTFKLLPGGGHRVILVDDRRVIFIDHSKNVGGKNARKLYYTEADYRRAKKLRDLSLASLYGSATTDVFSAVGTGAGLVFLGNRGPGRGPSTLQAYNPVLGRSIWTRKGSVTSTGLLLHRGRLWTGTVTRRGASRLVAYSPDDGSTVQSVGLDSPGQRAPVAAGEGVLVRTQKSIYFISPSAAGKKVVASASSPPAPPARGKPLPVKARPGWRLIKNAVARYLIQLPPVWHDEGIRRLGKKGYMVPFVRKQKVWGRVTHQGSVHLYSSGAEGRDAKGVWGFVLARRQARNPSLKLIKLQFLPDVGGSGSPGVLAIYKVSRRRGIWSEERCLCVVKGDVAYVLTATVASRQSAHIWTEIAGILRSFRPL